MPSFGTLWQIKYLMYVSMFGAQASGVKFMLSHGHLSLLKTPLHRDYTHETKGAFRERGGMRICINCGVTVEQYSPSTFTNMRSLFQNIVLITLSLSFGVAGRPAPQSESEPTLVKRANPQGCDVSNFQGGSLDWASLKSKGVQFAYIKATEGTS